MFVLCPSGSLSKNVVRMKSPPDPSPGSLNRREFIATTSTAAAGLLVAAPALAQVATTGPHRQRYALVGVGGRSGMYREAVLKTYAEHAQMVGF